MTNTKPTPPSHPFQSTAPPLPGWLRDEPKERFLRLSKVAIDILSTPAMSADPERTFFGARRTISWDRMLLGASTIEKGECLKSWMRSGITAGLQVDEAEQYEYMAGGKHQRSRGRCGPLTGLTSFAVWAIFGLVRHTRINHTP